MKKLLYILSAAIVAFSTVGCGKNAVTDLQGIVTANLSDGSVLCGVTLSGVNFTAPNKGASIISRGAIKGLDDLSLIPMYGWDFQSAIIAGNGYIFFDFDNNTYARVYVVSVSLVEGVVQVKYQMPFIGSTTEIIPQTKELNFDSDGGNEIVGLQSSFLFPFTAESSADWCCVHNKQYAIAAPYRGINIVVEANSSGRNREAAITVTPSGREPITIIVRQNRYKIGDYFDENGVRGVVFHAKGYNGKIVSMDETQAAWSTENTLSCAADQNDGMVNMNAIKRIQNWTALYPVFAWCDAKNVDGITGWYLPAINELPTIFDNRDAINSTLSANGGTTINSDWYWSSTEYNYQCAWFVYMYGGGSTNVTKYNLGCVRAVAAYE